MNRKSIRHRLCSNQSLKLYPQIYSGERVEYYTTGGGGELHNRILCKDFSISKIEKPLCVFVCSVVWLSV